MVNPDLFRNFFLEVAIIHGILLFGYNVFTFYIPSLVYKGWYLFESLVLLGMLICAMILLPAESVFCLASPIMLYCVAMMAMIMAYHTNLPQIVNPKKTYHMEVIKDYVNSDLYGKCILGEIKEQGSRIFVILPERPCECTLACHSVIKVKLLKLDSRRSHYNTPIMRLA